MRISNSQIKYVKSLQLKKYRQKYNKFVVEGVKLVTEIIRDFPQWVELVVTRAEIKIDFDKILMADNDEFKVLSSFTSPSGALAVVEIPSNHINRNHLRKNLNLYLDAIMDPGNMGTIIRTAEWFGIKQIILSEGCVDPFNPKVVQASMGAVYRMPIIHKNITEIENIENIQVLLATLEGVNVSKIETKPQGILVIGSESHGISQKVIRLPHTKVTIPSQDTNQSESLNAAIAAGILMYQLRLNVLE